MDKTHKRRKTFQGNDLVIGPAIGLISAVTLLLPNKKRGERRETEHQPVGMASEGVVLSPLFLFLGSHY
jgi:hypothetical protein